jgi:hypothetical protein
MFTLVHNTRVAGSDSSKFIEAFSDLYDQFLQNVGTFKDLAKIMEITSEDITSDEIQTIISDSMKNTAPHYLKSIPQLTQYFANLIDGKTDETENVDDDYYINQLIDKYYDMCQKSHQRMMEISEKGFKIDNYLIETLVQLINKYPNHSFSKEMTANGNDFDALYRSYFSIDSKDLLRLHIDVCFHENPSFKKFWNGLVGTAWMSAMMDYQSSNDQQWNDMNHCVLLQNRLMYIYGEENYVYRPSIVVFMEQSVGALSYALKNYWSYIQLFMNTRIDYLLADNDDPTYGELKNIERLTDVVSSTSYDAWLNNPTQFNSVITYLVNECLDQNVREKAKEEEVRQRIEQNRLEAQAQMDAINELFNKFRERYNQNPKTSESHSVATLSEVEPVAPTSTPVETDEFMDTTSDEPDEPDEPVEPVAPTSTPVETDEPTSTPDEPVEPVAPTSTPVETDEPTSTSVEDENVKSNTIQMLYNYLSGFRKQ